MNWSLRAQACVKTGVRLLFGQVQKQTLKNHEINEETEIKCE